MRTHGRYLKYIRNEYGQQQDVAMGNIFTLTNFDIVDYVINPKHDTFTCIVAGCTHIPENTREVSVRITYRLYDNLMNEIVTGLYDEVEDAVYINLDDFIAPCAWE